MENDASGDQDLTADVMWSVGRIAERDGIAKQTVSDHVKRMIDGHDLPVDRDSRGRVSAVNVIVYDALRERYGNPIRAQAPTRPGELPLVGSMGDGGNRRPNLDEAQLRKVLVDGELRRLELNERTGKLIRADRFADAITTCAEAIVRRVDRLPQEADKLAAALKLDDAHAVRLALKGVAQRLRTEIADELARVAAGAPETDEPLAQENDEED